MRFFGNIGARWMVAITAMFMAACQVQNPDADSKGAGGEDELTPRESGRYMLENCSELGPGVPEMAGNKILARRYTYKVSNSLTGELACEIPVRITKIGAKHMAAKGVTCKYVEASGNATGELHLRNLSTDTDNPYRGLKILCDTQKLAITGEQHGGKDRLVVRVLDKIPYYPEAFGRVMAPVMRPEDNANAAGAAWQVTKSVEEFEKALGANKKTGEGYAEAVQALRLMYITDDYLENSYAQTAADAMEEILKDISEGKVDIKEHRTVASNFVYGMNTNFFALTRSFYNKFHANNLKKEVPWFIEVKNIDAGQKEDDEGDDNDWDW